MEPRNIIHNKIHSHEDRKLWLASDVQTSWKLIWSQIGQDAWRNMFNLLGLKLQARFI